MKSRRRKSIKGLLVLLILGISIGFALLSKTLGINGFSGIKKNTWDVHWDDTSVSETEGSVPALTPAYVSDTEKKIVTFSSELELPGEFYEFTVDAKNYGTIDAEVEKIEVNFYEEDGVTPKALSSCLEYSFTHADGSAIQDGEELKVGKSIKYKFRLSFKDVETLECTKGAPKVVIMPTIIPIIPKDDNKPYTITFNPNGGTVDPTTKEVQKGEKIGELPVPTKDDVPFLGWYTGLIDGTKITSNTVPTSSTTYYAHWADNYTTFNTGRTVNEKFKTLAGDTLSSTPYYTEDTAVTAIVRSQTAPPSGVNTEIVSAENAQEIYAWFDNGTIKWYTEATTVYLNADASYMFTYFKNINNIDTSFYTNNTTDMSNMFGGIVIENLDLTSFDTSNVTYMSSMFSGATITNLDITNFDTSSVINMGSMFAGSNIPTLDLTSFNTSNVENMSSMFAGSRTEILDLSTFDVSKVTSFGGIFGGAGAKTINISNWNFDSMISLSGFMSGCGVENLILENVNTSKIVSMYAMFAGCSRIKTLDLTSFDTRNVTNMESMFAGMPELTTITVSNKFRTSKVTMSNSMFGGDTKLVGGLGTKYDPNHIDKLYARYDQAELKPGYFNAGEVTYHTVTFNPNGGSVEPTTKQVIEGTKIGDLPTATRDGMDFRGWYTEISGGTKITSDLEVNADITVYAHWNSNIDITYNANGGKFANNETTRNISYTYGSAPVTKYSHTPNINDSGVATNEYSSNLTQNDIVTIPGSDQLNIEVWFSTESESYDWLAIYPAGVEPNQNNYTSATISDGKLAGHGSYSGYTKPNDDDTTYHRTFTVNGDTAQFFFRSDSSSNYYGYYAIITGTGKGYTSDKEYEEPTRNNYVFTGWNTQADGTGLSLKTNEEINKYIDNESSKTLYAEWHELYTVTFNPNGGEVDPTSKQILSGAKVGTLPTPTKGDTPFLGWYTVLPDGTKINENVIPTGNTTYYAKWSSSYAIFDEGTSVNVKLKTLAGDELSETNPHTTSDTNITSIVKSDTAPDTNNRTDEHIVSSTTSPNIIYAWYDNGTIYWWSEATEVFLNQNADYMFAYFTNVTNIDIAFKTDITTNMGHLFYYDSSITSLNVSSFTTNQVQNMASMFGGMSNLVELNISNFDFSNYNPGNLTSNLSLTGYSNFKRLIVNNAILPANMYNGFANLGSVESISLENVDTSKVTTMQYMFDEDSHITELDLSSFNTSNVTSMYGMFYGANALETIDLSSFDISNVTTLEYMFYYCKNLVTLDLSYFDISNISKLDNMFYGTEKLEELNLSTWNFAKYNPGSLMYRLGVQKSLKKMYLDDVVLPQNLYYAFDGMNKLEEISFHNTNTRAATTMNYMFNNCDSLTELNLASFDTRNVTDMGGMFYSMDNIKTIMVSNKFEVDQVTSSYSMFYDDQKLVGGNGTVYDYDHIDKEYAHYDYGEEDPGYFDKADGTIYTIELDPNGGTVSPDTIYVRKNRKTTDLPTPYWREHVFTGWYTLPGGHGELVDENYTPQSNMKIYANWRSAELYTITFDANGGTVDEQTRQVYEGEELGPLPTATKEKYKENGWYTLPGAQGEQVGETYKPASSMTIHADWKVNFAEDDWEDIKEIAEENKTNLCAHFKLGDLRSINMGEYGTKVLRISNCSYSETYDTNTSNSQTANGLVIEFADVITGHRMNPYDENAGRVNGNGNKGGWQYSEMREFVNNDIYSALPSDLKSVIMDVRVISGRGHYDSANFTTTDKLYLLSLIEVFRQDHYDSFINDCVEDKLYSETRQLDYYQLYYLDGDGTCNDPIYGCIRPKKREVYLENYIRKNNYFGNHNWWLRNANICSGVMQSDEFVYINTGLLYSGTYDTGASYATAKASRSTAVAGVSPAFRIA